MSARVGMMMTLYLTAKKLSNDVENIRKYLKAYVFDPYQVDYEAYKKNLLHLKLDWDNTILNPLEMKDEDAEESIDVGKIIYDENNLLNIRENEENDNIFEARVIMLDKCGFFYTQVSDIINNITRDLGGILSDYKKLKNDDELLDEKIEYLSKAAFDDELWIEFKEIFDDFCEENVSDIKAAGNSISKLKSKWRTKKYLNFAITDRYARLIDNKILLREREKYTLEAFFNHLYYIKCSDMLKQKIDNASPKEELPESYYDFIKGVGLKEKKRKIDEIYDDITKTCPGYCPAKGKNCTTCRNKKVVLKEVFNVWLKHIDEMPKYKVFNSLFGKAITISENRYNTFSKEFAGKYHIK